MLITRLVITILTTMVIVMISLMNCNGHQFHIIQAYLENGYWLFADLVIKMDQGHMILQIHMEIAWHTCMRHCASQLGSICSHFCSVVLAEGIFLHLAVAMVVKCARYQCASTWIHLQGFWRPYWQGLWRYFKWVSFSHFFLGFWKLHTEWWGLALKN